MSVYVAYYDSPSVIHITKSPVYSTVGFHIFLHI